MSSLEKMIIQGIRSFGPDEKDRQIICFFSPLTLILGPNGTGKTTVIECLKYMTTGVMPPGSKGGAFIHDPKVAHEREVKGQVRLRIRDVTNQQMTIMRSIVATQKQKKIETRTIDGVISRISPTGEKKSITSRCAEIDREMITALGVSRPVLENVIFCHQEESNWPLSEGKALKEKFDAIFASTRYVKALENIRKLKQSQEGEIKLLRQEILFLKQHKEKALALEGDLHDTEIKLESSKESMEKIASKLDPIEKQLKDISVRANEIFQIQNRKTKYESDRDALFKTVKELKSNIKNEFSGSMEELQQSCDDFKIRVDEKRFKLQKCIKEQEEIGREIEGLNRKKNVLLVEVGKLQQEAQTNEENENKRDGQLRQIAQKYDFVGFDGEITQEVYRHFAESVKTKVEALMDESQKTKTEFEKKERDAQIELDKLREKKTSYEQNEKIKRDIMLDNMRKIEQIENKLSEVKVSAGRLEHLNRELRRAEHDLQTTDRSLDINVLKKEIQELSIEKASLDQSVNDLGAEMKRLHLQSAAQAQLDILRKDKATKEEFIKRLKAKQEDSLNHLLGNVPARNLRDQLEEYISKQGVLVKNVTENLNTQKSIVSSLEARRMMLMEDLKKKEANLKDFEKRIFTVCERSGFEDGLKSLQVKKTDVQNKKGSLLGAEHFFNKYIEDLGKKEPCCPLCHREFDTDQEVKELVLELKNKLRMVPSKLEKAELELKEFEKKYDRMMQLKPIKENIVTLEENDIPETKRKLSSVINKIQETHQKIQELDDEKTIQEQDEDIAKQLHPDVIQIDRYQGEIAELDRKIAVQAALLPGGDTGRNLQDVSNEKDEKQMILDDVTRKLEQKKEQISSHNEELQMLHKKVNDLRSHILTIDSDVQQQQKMQEDKNNLETDNHSYELEIKDCQEQIIPIKAQIEKYSREKDKVTEMKEEKLEDIKEETEAIKLEASKVRTINQSIKQYKQSGKASELANRQDELETIKMDAASKEREQDSLNTALERLRNDIATQQTRERELLDNLSLRKKQNEIQEIETLVEAEERKLGGIDANDLDRRRKRLMTDQDSLVKERHMAVGRQSGFEDTIRTLQKELQSEMYRDAAEKYRDKIIMLKTTEMANGDLEKYYKALDKAIMNYHNVKMEEINKIIRELWRNTYRGNDIETIEIRSDEDDSAATMKTRKTYNYRVVMVKGDTALDMRGRCSAGQKVLASLIIRMALAETFCLNCGVLALDEPTTNLDRENIESLAYALVEIIKSRSHQKNFQLVVITHDEDFVELLGRSDYVEKFYKVRKNSEGLSQLVEARVQELHTR